MTDTSNIDCQQIAQGLPRLGEPLKKSGKAIFYLCPFHSEKSPSFAVYHDGYKCFGCDERGDVISLVMKLAGLKYRDALQYLNIAKDTPYQAASPKPKPPTFPDYEPPAPVWQKDALDVVKYAHALLTEGDFGQPARRYLTEVRRLDPRVITLARLGYIPLPPRHPWQVFGEMYGSVKVYSGLIFPSFAPDRQLWGVHVRLPKPPIPPPPDEKPLKYLSWSGEPDENGNPIGGRLRGSMFLGQYWQPQKALYIDEGEINALSVWSGLHSPAYSGSPLIPLALSSTSNGLSRQWMERAVFAPRVYLRTDAGKSGDRLAADLCKLSRRIIRVQVPAPFKDPNELLQSEGLPALIDWIRGFHHD